MASSGATYFMLVTLIVFQVLMSLLKLMPQLLTVVYLLSTFLPKRKLMSVTRDTCST